jgi:type III restriction enzyme
MLKEGWDVTNLYTIVPLRAANSKTLVEQSIGRGLRLPYGRRTGRPAVDRLTIVSHDRFQEIVDEANRPDSIIKTGIVIGRDIPAKPSKVVTVTSLLDSALSGTQALFPTAEPTPRAPVYTNPREQQIALKAMEVTRQYENDPKRVPTIEALKTPEIKAEIARKVEAALHPLQTELPEAGDSTLIAEIVGKTIDLQVELSIDIPRILVVPVGVVQSGFADFDLDDSGINLQPVAKDILIQHLRTSERHRLISGDGVIPEDRLEDYLVRGLIDFDDINYDDHAGLLYKLAGQVVARLQSYLSDPEDVLNVLQFHQQPLVKLIHAQMLEHYQERATSYEARVSKGFTTLHASSFAVPADEAPRNFRAPVDEKLMIKGLLFSGFRKCLYPAVKFDSDTERRFSVILEDAPEVLKWFRPARSDLQIHYAHDSSYEPDFVVETKTRKFLCELKRASDIDDTDVQAKSAAAVTWCRNASTHATEHGAKPWSYILIPHDAIATNKTFSNLSTTYAVKS